MYTGPQIVTSGLVLYLDAGNTKSYPGTGTTWYDRSGNLNSGVVNNGTLVNSPTFSSLKGGSIVFNGTNNYATLGSPTGFNMAPSGVTMLFWIYNNYPGYYLGVFERITYTGAALTTALPTTGWVQVGYSSDGSSNYFIINGVRYISNGLGRYVYDYSLDKPLYSSSNLGYFPGPGSQNFCFQVQEVASTGTGTYVWSDLGYRMLGVTSFNVGTKYFNGNFSQVQVYNRALSATEILQNYNATRTRFGI
jgi:hypothetical protein